MGTKGARLTGDATLAAEEAADRLAPLGAVTSKKMFGGYGVFVDGKMFALIDSEGALFFKVDDSNEQRYLDAGSDRHARMPYRQVPASIWHDDAATLEWARLSMEIALG